MRDKRVARAVTGIAKFPSWGQRSSIALASRCREQTLGLLPELGHAEETPLTARRLTVKRDRLALRPKLYSVSEAGH